MKPERNAKRLLAITRSKAKMYEYDLPETSHIKIDQNLTTLLDVTLGALGDYAASLNKENNQSIFSAYYFDALFNSKVASSYEEYLKLLGSAAYYLNGFPGSSSVLVASLDSFNLNANGLEILLLSILKRKFIELPSQYIESSPYINLINDLYIFINRFYERGEGKDEIIRVCNELRNKAYDIGNDRELLFSDLIRAICNQQINTSLWTTLPRYSNLDKELWSQYIANNKHLYELWPAQMMIGENDIFQGASGVIQIPTSAGKTKATELIIRSAFLSNRIKLAVIVAPFRALSQEIADNMTCHFKDMSDVFVNLVSDVLQDDIEIVLDQKKQVFVLTPEKLDYLLRQMPELSNLIGLIVYDEGHLFDDPFRGPRYELLLSALKKNLSPETQIVLISAVMPNPSSVGKWLIGSDSKIIEARNYSPTSRSIAFVSWKDAVGRLEFVNIDNIDEEEFFVPRLLSEQNLNKLGRETKERTFPAKDKKGLHNPYHTALLLGCRLSAKGGVAIFSGRKDSARLMAENMVDAIERGANLTLPKAFSNDEELDKLINYTQLIYGEDSLQVNAAKL
ncbi:DEAD/DEAH box helicase, partial [Candidatus Pacearchaeota archaeon]|nr:DEAD/DEAH box helicase [Candidatus Pacearchaeota archaeon]